MLAAILLTCYATGYYPQDVWGWLASLVSGIDPTETLRPETIADMGNFTVPAPPSSSPPASFDPFEQPDLFEPTAEELRLAGVTPGEEQTGSIRVTAEAFFNGLFGSGATLFGNTGPREGSGTGVVSTSYGLNVFRSTLTSMVNAATTNRFDVPPSDDLLQTGVLREDGTGYGVFPGSSTETAPDGFDPFDSPELFVPTAEELRLAGISPDNDDDQIAVLSSLVSYFARGVGRLIEGGGPDFVARDV